MKALVVLASLTGLASAEPITIGANLGLEVRDVDRGTPDQFTSTAPSVEGELGTSLDSRLVVTGFVRLRVSSIGSTQVFGHDNSELWLGGRFRAFVNPSLFVGVGVAWLAAFASEDYWTGMALEGEFGVRIPAGAIAIEPVLEIGRIDLNAPVGGIYARVAIGIRWR